MTEWTLTESEGYDLLKKYDIPVPEYGIATTPEQAADIAAKIGFPVVMKIVSPQILHKSDAGGVIVGVASKEEAISAYNKIRANVSAYDPKAEIKGVIVVEMAQSGGVELLIGGNTDTTFGKVITFGIGGVLVELLHDVSLRILPASESEIREMIREINSYKLISGYRGDGPKDEELLVKILIGASKMFAENDIKEFDINPLRLYEKGACALDSAIIMSDELDALHSQDYIEVPLEYFNPKTIAVIGASDDPSKMGYACMRNLLDFEGPLYPVNNRRDVIMGRKVYASVLDIPEETVDMVVITVPGRIVPSVMEECGQKGVKVAVVITAGFKEMSEEGEALENEVVAIARKYGTRIVGPNCLGLIIPPIKVDTTYVKKSPNPGNIAFISQSGAIVNTVVDWSLVRGIGYSMVVSVGNQADLNFFDYLRWADSDPNTRAIIMYVEQIKNGKAFLEVVSEVTKNKPVIALKAGSSKRGQAAAASHTGSLSGSWEVYVEAFKKAGVLLVHDLTSAFYAAEMLSHPKGYPKGRRAVVVTNAGGFAVLSTDYAERYGIEIIDLPKEVIAELDSFLPEFWNRGNPVDLLGDATDKRFEMTFDVLAKHSDLWDMCFMIGFPNNILTSERVAELILDLSKKTENRIIPTLLGGEWVEGGRKKLQEVGLPNFDELDYTYRVVGRMMAQKFRAKGVGLY
ncbi:MAG: acetate--CoA ligase family protein [Euryarchaeota archaeon]|nr:acetate--CoA ligase family protein [Euryarchaeota archaeon]